MQPISGTLTNAELAMSHSQALGHWLSLRPPAGGLPAIAAQNLADWPGTVLPNLTLVAGRPGIDRLVLDFIGNISAIVAGSLTGSQFLDEFYSPDQMRHATDYFTAAAGLAGPMLVKEQLGPDPSRVWLEVTRLTLPFADSEGVSALFATIQLYRPTPEGLASRAQIVKDDMVLVERQYWRVAGR